MFFSFPLSCGVDQLRITLADSKSNSDRTYKSLFSSEQRTREVNAQLRKYCQKLTTHLSEIQAELSAQSTRHSQKNRVDKERERELKQQLDILLEENKQLHERRLVENMLFLITLSFKV